MLLGVCHRSQGFQFHRTHNKILNDLLLGNKVREYLWGNEKWRIQRNWQHRVHKAKKNKTKTQHNMAMLRVMAAILDQSSFQLKFLSRICQIGINRSKEKFHRKTGNIYVKLIIAMSLAR
jgi:hypothetical protein